MYVQTYITRQLHACMSCSLFSLLTEKKKSSGGTKLVQSLNTEICFPLWGFQFITCLSLNPLRSCTQIIICADILTKQIIHENGHNAWFFFVVVVAFSIPVLLSRSLLQSHPFQENRTSLKLILCCATFNFTLKSAVHEWLQWLQITTQGKLFCRGNL